MDDFHKKLNERRAAHAQALEASLVGLHASLLSPGRADPAPLLRRLEEASRRMEAVTPLQPLQAQVDLSAGEPLRALDAAFIDLFHLSGRLPVGTLDYPTVYCETPEEFYGALLAGLELSPAMRQAELERLVIQARERAEHGGVYGINLPGLGCFLNGWLFAFRTRFSPAQLLRSPKHLPTILTTVTHEKLGHGFLSTASALGKAKTRLGLDRHERAARFGLRLADDPLSSLRQEQSNLLGLASQLLEEGWATWLESFLGARRWGKSHPRHSLQAVTAALEELDLEGEEDEQVKATLFWALERLFAAQPVAPQEVLRAVLALEILGSALDGPISQALGQPLRYAVGELLFVRAVQAFGLLCAPYIALIAANVQMDPTQVGLGDLRELLQRDPRIHPDARLALIAQLSGRTRDDPPAMAAQIESELSFATPPEVK